MFIYQALYLSVSSREEPGRYQDQIQELQILSVAVYFYQPGIVIGIVSMKYEELKYERIKNRSRLKNIPLFLKINILSDILMDHKVQVTFCSVLSLFFSKILMP